MTWIIGATTLFGYGVVLSDVCVTLGDGSQRDCLRKTYLVGRFIVAGFAGSVQIGFHLLADLSEFLKMEEEEIQDKSCWQPTFVANKWAPRARKIFASYDPIDQKMGSHILMMGIDPRHPDHCIRGGVAVVSVLRSPNFEPVIEEGGGRVMSIGSGSCQEEAMNLLAKFVQNVDLMKMEVMNDGGFGHAIASSITRDLFFGAPSGVSRHMHVSVVGIDSFSIRPNDINFIPREGPEQVLRMPKIAQGWQDLCDMLDLNADNASGVVAAR